MDYRELNRLQRSQMDLILNPNHVMEWEDPGFMDILMGKLPAIRHIWNEESVTVEILKLEKLLDSYNAFTTDKEVFLQNVRKRIADIYTKNSRWFGISENEIENCIHHHEFCLISGEGGIGKSFFIRKLEGNLEAAKIPHLCIYGKFEKDILNLDIQSIIKDSLQGFVFIVDAINEMSERGQQDLLPILLELKKHPTIRIIVTYRTNSLTKYTLKAYQELAMSEYTFPGVSFESALDLLLKLPVPDSQRYEDILYSNNALLLNMLKTVLQNPKVVEGTEKGIASVTYILEQYIKHATPKLQNGVVGREIWKDTKSVAQWMYEQEKNAIDQDTLLSLVKSGNQYISVMTQIGFLSFYKTNSTIYFYFAIELLMNYLIARSLLQNIQGECFSEQVKIIKNKTKNIINLEEPLTIAIFDAFSSKQGYEYIQKLLSESGLIEKIRYSTFVKIYYDVEHIPNFLRVFSPSKPNLLLEDFGGYINKPFNCTNFLRDYYLKNPKNQVHLSVTLEGTHFNRGIKNRLKNILYVITLNNQIDREKEAYNFALLCSAAPNKSIQCLALKILYTLCLKDSVYHKKLITDYQYFSDHYIKESIIYVLSQANSSNPDIKTFFNRLILEEPELTSKSIKRIAAYLGDEYGYIHWERQNLYQYVPNASISESLGHILHTVSAWDKYALPFEYWSKDDIHFYTKFLDEKKEIIHNANCFLQEKYSCVRTGRCQGNYAFETFIKNEISDYSDFSDLDSASILSSLDPVMESVFTHYTTTQSPTFTQDFKHSLYMKCVHTAIGLFYGSLMCNYYTNKFATYNNQQNSIGYEVYDPLAYGEEIQITSPIPVYQSFVERLNRCVLNNIELPEAKDSNWAKNTDLTRTNILNLLKPLNIKGETWFLVAGRISIHEDKHHDMIWKDTYNIWCCTSEKESIRNDGQSRYLTIELLDYQENLTDYKNCTKKPWLCKDVKCIADELDVLEETELVLPPAEMIDALKLFVDISDMSWSDASQTKAILCNNNKSSYYKDPIGRTVYIRKDFLEKYLEKHNIKFFAFAERYTQETGFPNETSLHFEIQNGRIVKEILNNERVSVEDETHNLLCDNCPFGFEKAEIDYSEVTSKLETLLGVYSWPSNSTEEPV